MSGTRVVVIGGGFSGLASACLLARDGHKVTLIERHESVGGRAGTWSERGFTFDTGPSWYLMPEVFDRFFSLMGTSTREQLDLVELEPAYRVYGEPGSGSSTPIDVTSGVDAVAELFESREPGAASRLRDYAKSASRVYRIATESFLSNPFTSWRSLCDVHVVRAGFEILPLLTISLWRRIAARFRDVRLRQILGYPAVFLGTSPFAAPSLYHLMSHMDLVDRVRYPIGGFARLVSAIRDLAVAHGVTIMTRTEVTRIDTAQRAAQGVTVRHEGETRSIPADIVVATGDMHHTETALLSPNDRSYPERKWKKQVASPGAVLIMLGVAGELPQLLHHTLLFSDDWDANFRAIFDDRRVPEVPSMYVSKTSATDSVAPVGHEALFVLVPLPADVALGGGGIDGSGDARVEAIADAAIAQIAEWAGIDDLQQRIVVRRTVGPRDFADHYFTPGGSALGPAHTLAQSAFFRGRTASKRVRGLYYAGSTTVPGVGVPMCLISAELVLKHVRGDHSAAPLGTERAVR